MSAFSPHTDMSISSPDSPAVHPNFGSLYVPHSCLGYTCTNNNEQQQDILWLGRLADPSTNLRDAWSVRELSPDEPW
jgi:hypothetical protein